MRVLRNQRAVHDTSHIKRIFFPDTFIPHLHSTVCGHDYTYQHRRRGIPTARKRYFHWHNNNNKNLRVKVYRMNDIR